MLYRVITERKTLGYRLAFYTHLSCRYNLISGNLRSTTRQARRRGLQNKIILHEKETE